jgi:phosphotransferase system enzyme I (PtsI)
MLKMINDKKTIIIKGIGASPGLAFGKARVIYHWEQAIEERTITAVQVDGEHDRLDNAVREIIEELKKNQRKARQKIGGPVAAIFDSQIMIASDQEFIKKVKTEIKNRLKCTEYIYSMLVDKSLAMLRKSKDQYMNQMAYDIEAISNRVLRKLSGDDDQEISPSAANCVFVGKRFTPAEVLNLFERNARAIVSTEGSPNSHMALVARSLLVPTVVGAGFADLKIGSGDRVIVDGEKGQVTVNPSQETWDKLRGKETEYRDLPIARIKQLPRFPLKTKDGHVVDIAVNLTLPGPLDQTLAGRKLAVGLYRTEFIYLQHGRFPSEDSQYEIYKSVARQYYPQEVVMRTYDLGSDKVGTEDKSNHENNPALGWRGIRLTLDTPRIFKDQVRAMLRASSRGNVKILLPMISDIQELRKALTQINKAKSDLKKQNIEFDENIEIGMMVEVPAAAVAADLFADRVDFLSIGSNDLTQYTLAADRSNRKVVRLFNQLHPAVLRLVKLTINAAEVHNIPVNICGEVSGDVLAIPLLVGMGLKQLSMNPSGLYNAARIVRKFKYTDAIQLADRILKLKSVRDVESKLLEFNMALE